MKYGRTLRRVFLLINLLASCLFLSIMWGCAPKAQFVLLADPDGTVGEIVVETQKGEQVVDQANYETQVRDQHAAPSMPTRLSSQNIEKRYGAVMQALPAKPVHFMLYFDGVSTHLSPDSMRLIPNILQTVQKRLSRDISVVGHADRTGSEAFNRTLSENRARTVSAMLIAAGIPAEDIEVTSHGENNPLIATADNVPEPRNRRVEVTVR